MLVYKAIDPVGLWRAGPYGRRPTPLVSCVEGKGLLVWWWLYKPTVGGNRARRVDADTTAP
jgi:hypothetical protein